MSVLRKITLFLATILLFTGVARSQCYELVWSDEFNDTGFPNAEYWTGQTGAGGWGNNELQYYKNDDPDNLWMSDGTLKITAIKESYSGSSYTSARIITRGKYNFHYGRIEGRMKLPFGQGIWPAFWMMGESLSTVGWPYCSETDIMEMIGGSGREKTVYGTGHWDNNGSHASYGGNYTLSSGTFADTFHVFAVEWTPEYISWFVDGTKFVTLNIEPSGLSEFHGDNFILLNLAVGGNWPGNPDATTTFPQTLEVDYVRVYQIDPTPAIEGDSVIAMNSAGLHYSIQDNENWTYNWTVPADASIISGQGTPDIAVDWGCNEGQIVCSLTNSCSTKDIVMNVSFDYSINGPMFVDENETDVLFTAFDMPNTTYTWTVPEDATITAGEGTDSLYVNWGSTFTELTLTMENSCGAFDTTFSVIKKGQYPYPDIQTAHPIPGTIYATEYDYGGEGEAYHDLTAENEGSGVRSDESVDTEFGDNGNANVGWISSGEWLEYTVKVEAEGWYKAKVRVATNNGSGGPFYINFNGEQKFGPINVSNTGSWTSFVELSSNSAWLTPEDTLMRLNFATGGFNLSTIKFVEGTPASTKDLRGGVNISVYPNPARNNLQISCDENISSITIVDLAGKTVLVQNGISSSDCLADVSKLTPGFYLLNVRGESGEASIMKFMKIE